MGIAAYEDLVAMPTIGSKQESEVTYSRLSGNPTRLMDEYSQ